ncbi:MAG: tyrosine-type recombinase/integrase [Candidatus Dormibacteria bacterium]
MVQALRWELVSRNVSELVDPSRTERFEPQTLEADQVRRLFAAAVGSRLEALWVLPATTGMRQGQLLALRWRDVDLAKGTLTVTGNLQRLPGEGLTILEAKTTRSRHQVLIGPLAVAALRAHRSRQAAARLQAADTWEDHDLMFTTATGRPVDAHDVRPTFYHLLAATGLPRVRFHDLRHSAATLLLGEGIHPKIVSEMLGHSTVTITLDTYSHVTAAMHRSAADTLDTLLSPQAAGGAT